MSVTDPAQVHAFRALARRLARRRLRQLDLRVRIELAAIALLIDGFVFWQTRVPLDGLVRAHGPAVGVLAVAAGLAALLIAALTLAALHHARRLEAGPRGPEWLALPLVPAPLAAHLAGESSALALWLAAPAAAILAASIGIVPVVATVALALAFAPLLAGARAVGGSIGLVLALRRIPAGGRGAPIERVLAVAAPRARRRRLPRPAWRRMPAWRALVEKDLRVTWRRGALRRSALMALVVAVASLAAWWLPAELPLRHFIAFGLALVAAALLAQWLVALSGSDPFDTLRTLPIGLGGVWGARAVWALAGALLLVTSHALVARELSPHALEIFLVWSGLAAVGIGVLGVNYGVTLFPRADLAERMLGLSLGLAVAASIMIPLSGWIVLLTAILHSARRLPRWSRLEAS
ncbi:MAG: hypothetical protein HY076_03870 [Candidatus Eisenbacteria bacterium]|uniref:Uncharacterized protein n=1 Tax=Eiseniibacteriota bacterium TaxID=2212470 RepID=A0A9D6QM51_UNCEI|nr:hypothetical protein [Candidatus Eisenbacteria bacterium]MBI3539393.1 hypothetical protein [Candidatus Eisenbacteria bacterium]